MRISRRRFVQAAAAPMLVAARPQSPPASAITAQQLIDRIRGAIGVPWREKTIDGVKAGDPATVLTGVAVTVAARLDNLRRAAAAGCNLVITQEPVFYGPNDEPGNRAKDAVYLAKKAYIEEAKLVVWRFSDHWSARQPDPRVTALAEALGWSAERRECGHDPGDVLVVADGTRAEPARRSRRRANPGSAGHAGANGAAQPGDHRHGDHDGGIEERRRGDRG